MRNDGLCLLVILSGCNLGHDTNLKAVNFDPTATITSHADGAVLIEGRPATFEGLGSDPTQGVEHLEAAWWLAEAPICDWAPLGPGGETACSVNTLVPGEGSLELMVRDSAGATVSAVVVLQVDATEPPDVAIELPLDGAVAYADQDLELAGSVSDDHDTLDDLHIEWVSDVDGSLGSGLSVLAAVTPGDHLLTLRAEDTVGRVGEDTVQVSVFPTNTPPLCEVTAPEDGGHGDVSTTTVLEVFASDGEDVPASLVVSWESDVDGALGDAAVDGGGVGTLDVSGLSTGTHTLTATVTDSGGALCTDAITYVFGTAPVVTIDTPLDGELVGEGTLVSFSGSVSDAEDPAELLAVSWESDLDGVLDTADAATDGTTAFDTSSLSLGAHHITLRAADQEGLTGTDAITVSINGKPGAPVVSLSPDPAVTSDDLVVSIDTPSTDPEGDTITYQYVWSVDGVVSAASSSATLPASATTRDEVWSVVVTPHDGLSDGPSAAAARTVDNSAPVMASVTLSPSPVYEGDTLTCTPAATDADGDTVSYSYAWTVNGGTVSATSSTLSSVDFDRGDSVVCTVTPTDGTDVGVALASAAVTVDNTAPSIAAVSITPASPAVTDDLSCTYSGYADADGDSDASTFAWTVNGAAAGTGSTLSTGSFTAGDTITCTVTPDDGTDTGTAVSDSVVADNTAPEIDSLAISPAAPGVSDTLTCTATASDADGHTVTIAYEWFVEGAVAGTGSTLSGAFSKGDTVTCIATPDDGTDVGASASDSVTVDNTAPVMASVTLSPDPAVEGDTLTCSPSATDADGDTVSFTYAWTVSSSTISPTSSTLSSAYFDRGDTVSCIATPSDGTDTGTAQSSNTISVDNSAPSISAVSITPTSPAITDTLTCSYSGFTDPDGDTDASTYAWTVNGTAAGTGSTLAAGAFAAGDTITCTVTPDDGTDTGTPVADSVTAENTAPEVTSVTVTPTTPTVSDTLTCTATSTDADGDTVTLSYAWTIGGTTVGTTSTLSSAFSKGDTVTCTVTPHDGTESGTTGSDSVTVDNTAPVMASVTLSPDPAVEGDTLTCSPSATDADGDTVSYAYAWTVSSTTIAPTSSTLSSAYFDRGDTVTCTATPTDGTDSGTALSSNTISVDNSAPSISAVSITPTSPAITDTLTCTYSGFSDPDGDSDASTYAWTVNGVLAGTSTSLSPSSFSSGDTITCTVTPDDGTDTGTPVADSVTPSNTPPEVTSVTVTPTSPLVSDTLTCSATSTDDDGDTVTLSYAWTIGGTTVGTSSTLSSGFSSGDTVTCTVTPHDGTESGTTGADSVTIGNSAPEVTSVTISPTAPTASDTLTCSAATTDPDGDTVTLSYAWAIGGTTVGTSSTLSSGYSRGDTVTCTVTPHDGTVAGASDADSVVIDNTAPTVASVTITPSSPTVTDTLTVSYSTADADGDSVTVDYEWTVNGSVVSTASTLSGSSFDKHDSIVVTLTPDDGTDTGTAVSSSSVTAVNSPPEGLVTAIDPDKYVLGFDDLWCYDDIAPTDDDGDTVTYTITWEGDGLTYPDDFATATGPDTTLYTDDTVPVGDVSLALEWSCTITPNDGEDDGTASTATATEDNLYAVGNSTPTGSGLTASQSYIILQKVTITSTVTVEELGSNWYSLNGSPDIKMMLFDDNGGPDALIAETALTPMVVGANEVPVTTPVSISAGDYYVGYVYGGGSGSSSLDGTTGGSDTVWYTYHSYTSALPDPLTGESSYTGQTLSLYVLVQ